MWTWSGRDERTWVVNCDTQSDMKKTEGMFVQRNTKRVLTLPITNFNIGWISRVRLSKCQPKQRSSGVWHWADYNTAILCVFCTTAHTEFGAVDPKLSATEGGEWTRGASLWSEARKQSTFNHKSTNRYVSFFFWGAGVRKIWKRLVHLVIHRWCVPSPSGE